MLNADNCQPNIVIQGEIIETVKIFKYLGSIKSQEKKFCQEWHKQVKNAVI